MKHFAVVAAFLCSVSVLDAQRIETNSDPSGELKLLFPNATAFSPLSGYPLHFTAHGSLRSNGAPDTLGYAFWTTDLMPDEAGFHGPLYILIGMDLAGVLTGIVVDYDTEPYGHFSIRPREFARQFERKSIRDPFLVGRDIEAVSRASITMDSAARAIRDSARLMARALLNPAAVK